MSIRQDFERCAKVPRRLFVGNFRCKVLGNRKFLFLGKTLRLNKDGVSEGTQDTLLLVLIHDDVVMFKVIETERPMEAWLCADFTLH
jgi:hypothetical protein